VSGTFVAYRKEEAYNPRALTFNPEKLSSDPSVERRSKMASNIILFGWNRSIPGREKVSAQHFEEFVKYLGGLQQKGAIQGFETVFLDTHGGDLNGFFLIKGDPTKLDALISTTEWTTHITRASLHLDGSGVIRGVTGNEVMERMTLWTSVIPS
jgi:hypothetical protein